jgi:serine/threonine protein kinase
MTDKTGSYIGKYRLTRALCGQNSGYARWGFAEYGGTEYFIKEFISPVYPGDTSEISKEIRGSLISECLIFEAKKSKLYRAINSASGGNIIGVLDLFRYGSRYYIVTEKVEVIPYDADMTASLPYDKQLVLLKALLYNIKCIHDAGIVHADLKKDNLIIKRTHNGYYTAKLIDFDSSFFENEPPGKDELQGDMVYLAPETFLRMNGEDIRVTRRADIFALGIIFHEILCGYRPSFPDCYGYIYEAVLDGADITADNRLPADMRGLIKSMTAREPQDRPAADQIFRLLSAMDVPPAKKAHGGFIRSAGFD